CTTAAIASTPTPGLRLWRRFSTVCRTYRRQRAGHAVLVAIGPANRLRTTLGGTSLGGGRIAAARSLAAEGFRVVGCVRDGCRSAIEQRESTGSDMVARQL